MTFWSLRRDGYAVRQNSPVGGGLMAMSTRRPCPVAHADLFLKSTFSSSPPRNLPIEKCKRRQSTIARILPILLSPRSSSFALSLTAGRLIVKVLIITLLSWSVTRALPGKSIQNVVQSVEPQNSVNYSLHIVGVSKIDLIFLRFWPFKPGST